ALIAFAQARNVAIYRAIERRGRDNTISYLFTLPYSEEQNFVWLPGQKHPEPQIQLIGLNFNDPAWQTAIADWQYKTALVGVNSSQPNDTHYTFDDGSWKRVVGYQRIGQEIIHQDYAASNGSTLRFGDGEFGVIPAEGTVFLIRYRIGAGRYTNVTKDSITKFDNDALSLNFISSITNPLNAEHGSDPETHDEVRQSAP